jgi:hypothetical protein
MSQNVASNSNLRKISANNINTISTLKTQDFQKQYSTGTVNLWKHLEKTKAICTFNETVRNILLHLCELHKQTDGRSGFIEMVRETFGLIMCRRGNF